VNGFERFDFFPPAHPEEKLINEEIKIIKMKKHRLVIMESPFNGDRKENLKNINYARRCMRDCLLKEEYPFASHLLYTQEGILNDNIQEERNLGIEAGLCWGRLAEATIVYTDFGITDGMKKGIKRAEKEGRKVEYRRLE